MYASVGQSEFIPHPGSYEDYFGSPPATATEPPQFAVNPEWQAAQEQYSAEQPQRPVVRSAPKVEPATQRPIVRSASEVVRSATATAERAAAPLPRTWLWVGGAVLVGIVIWKVVK